jgi:uroporphyrinogen decarboxylase
MSRLIDALGCRNQGRAPIWLMRQAGRYLPSYRKLKEGRTLWEMFHDPETVVKVTLLPVDLLEVDGAILFTDILTVLEGLGIAYDFQEGVGPIVIDPPSNLCMRSPEEAYAHIKSAIQMLKQELKIPLLGFAGAPFTIASYMIEGRSSSDLKKTKQWLYQERSSFQKLIEDVTEATIAYLHYQIDAGIEAIQLFDTWANALGLEEFQEFSLKPMKAILEALAPRAIPTILFCRGSCLFAEELASLAPSAISLDWGYDLKKMRQKIPSSIAIQGNLDPMALFAPREILEKKVEKLLASMEGDPGYIFNLGHGILPETPLQNVQHMVDYVRNRSSPFAQAQ